MIFFSLIYIYIFFFLKISVIVHNGIWDSILNIK